MNSVDRHDQWSTWGAHYGYPSCCVLAFSFSDRSDVRKFHGTGYIPCAVCNAHSHEFLAGQINEKRSALLKKFPDDQWSHLPAEMMLNEYAKRDNWAERIVIDTVSHVYQEKSDAR